MIPCANERVLQKMEQAQHLWFFLDYDGTLADFAATPEVIVPDKTLIALIERLLRHPDIRVSIISGRRLAHIQALLPLAGLLIAGTYGLEIYKPDGTTIHRLDYDTVRPLLDDLKKEWGQLLAGHNGFFLEDKGWTLAIHAKDAAEEDAITVLSKARLQADSLLEAGSHDLFRLQGGHRFLECGPRTADKKGTVDYLLSAFPWFDDALLIYAGDDDKDEVAFELIQAQGGIVVAVGERLRDSAVDCWLPSPDAVRNWLTAVIEGRAARGNPY